MNFAFKDKYQAIFVKPREQVGFGLWFAGFLAAGGAAGATALTVSRLSMFIFQLCVVVSMYILFLFLHYFIFIFMVSTTLVFIFLRFSG